MVAGVTNPGSSIQVFTGRLFDPLDPDPASIHIEDIAHGLARQIRFLGQGRDYTVAEHSVHVSRACDPGDALEGLFHDSPEAYIGDWPTPLKSSPLGEGFRAAEEKLMAAICIRFGLNTEKPVSVSRADKAMLERERKLVFVNSSAETEAQWELWREAIPEMDDSDLPDYCQPQWWPAEIAERIFLDRFLQLGGK
jgi:uncharacterized protein